MGDHDEWVITVDQPVIFYKINISVSYTLHVFSGYFAKNKITDVNHQTVNINPVLLSM